MPDILKVLSQSSRDEYVELLIDAHNKVEKANEYEWRIKILIAEHIQKLSSLISTEKLNNFYVPKFFDLCLDDVFEVRETTAKKATAAILKNIAASGKHEVLNHVMD